MITSGYFMVSFFIRGDKTATLAHEGIGATPGYAEEIRKVEQELRQLPSVRPEDFPMFATVIAIHAMTFGICAAEDRQQTVEARAEKYVDGLRKSAETITEPNKSKLH